MGTLQVAPPCLPLALKCRGGRYGDHGFVGAGAPPKAVPTLARRISLQRNEPTVDRLPLPYHVEQRGNVNATASAVVA